MIYGLYLSATGVMTNSLRQDTIANNLANAETAGFKKNLVNFRQRLPASQERAGYANPLLDRIGGGTLVDPTQVDTSQGDFESTDNPLDAAINGPGYFLVNDRGQQRLTRSGQFLIRQDGTLCLSGGGNQPVLGVGGAPVKLDGTRRNQTEIAQDGTITQDGAPVARLAIVNAPNPVALRHEGGNLFSYADPAGLSPSDSVVRGGFTERANVDPATEMAGLIDAQRQLEMNANMIRYQDQTLDRLVNSVGKIG